MLDILVDCSVVGRGSGSGSGVSSSDGGGLKWFKWFLGFLLDLKEKI